MSRWYKSRNKYGAKKVTVDGVTFDSEGEYGRHCELVILERAGIISDLEHQPVYELQPKFKSGITGKAIQAITYRPDWRYIEGGRLIAEDFKGFETAAFKRTKKMFRYKYPDIPLKITSKTKGVHSEYTY